MKETETVNQKFLLIKFQVKRACGLQLDKCKSKIRRKQRETAFVSANFSSDKIDCVNYAHVT